MARQTRAQRRERRQAQSAASPAPRTTTQRPAVAEPSDGGRLEREGPRRPEAEPRGGRRARGRRFISESWGELKKVDWPGQNQVVQGTAVVLIACVIVGVYLYLSDIVFKHLVQNVFLGQ